MTPDDALRHAASGDLLPVYLITGEERFLLERTASALRRAAVGTGFSEMNEDRLTAGECDVERALAAARMAPMMSKRRVVLVRAVERWDARKDEESGSGGPDTRSPLDRLAAYAEQPVPSTCMLLLAEKLDGRRKLSALARKNGFVVNCEPLPRPALTSWIVAEARERGSPIAEPVADLLGEIAGPELSHVADALERLCLYAGAGQPITEASVSACVIRMRESTVWELVGAVGKRNMSKALAALADVYDPRDRGLRLVGILAWSVRQLLKFEAATCAGFSSEEAARKAGAPPFKGRDLAAQVRQVSRGELERWLLLLGETDLALKGSRRPPEAILQSAILQMCGGTTGPSIR